MSWMELWSFVKLHRGSLDEGTARNIMWQVIEAANVCVNRCVFYRDIKMENLVVNQDTMEVKLIDFGCGVQMKKFGYEVFSGICYELLCWLSHRIASYIIIMCKCVKWTKPLSSRHKSVLSTRGHRGWQIPCKADNSVVASDPPVHDGVRILSHRIWPGSDQ